MLKTRSGYIVLAIFLFGCCLGKAQSSLNDYKYIVVPKKFDGFKKENQYQTNTLVKYLFTQKGFTTVWEDGMPEDLANNQCKALFVSLSDKSSMFSTKAKVILEDCNKQEIFTTIEGKSKSKEFKKSYNEAITEAMTSFDGLNYKYEGEKSSEPITVSFKNDVKKLDEPKETSVSTKETNKQVIVQEATTTNQKYENNQPIESNIKKAVSKKDNVDNISDKQETLVLYAQEIPNGYQLVDNAPKIVLKILKTSVPDYYLAEGQEGSGMVYIKDGKWFFEQYKGENLVREELNIKF